MATNYWIGVAPLQKNILLFTCSAPTLGDTRYVEYNGRRITVLASDTSATTLAGQLVAAIQASTDARVKDGTAVQSGATFTVTGPADGAPLTSPGVSTGVTLTTNTAGTGPYHLDNVVNYSSGALPANGDTLVFDYGLVNSGPRYGLTALTAVTLAKIIVKETYFGNVGLFNNRGPYIEFRPKYLATAAAAFEIYSAGQDADERLKFLCTSAAAVAWIVQGAGVRGPNGWPLEVSGTVLLSTFVVNGYGLAVAPEPAAVAVAQRINANNSALNLGAGLTALGSLSQIGGSLTLAGQVTTANLTGVAVVVQGAGNVGTLNQDGGSVVWKSSVAATAHNGFNGATIDYSQAAAVLALPQTTFQKGCGLVEGGRLTRPWEVVGDGCLYSEIRLDITRGFTVQIDN